jgi:hypothetical protein
MNCLKCNKEITSTNESFPKDAVDLINLYLKESNTGYCLACAKNDYLSAINWRQKRMDEIKNEFKKNVNIDRIPNLNCIAPNNWNYYALGIVVSRVITPQVIFQSDQNVISNSIKESIFELYLLALIKGGNLVINIDLDFLELNKSMGFDKTIETTTGTAIKLNDLTVLSSDQIEIMKKITENYSKEFNVIYNSNTYKV